MTRPSRLALTIGLLTLLGLSAATAQEASTPRIEERLSDPVYMAWVSHQDLASCIRCHLSGPNVGEIIADQGTGLTSFSRRQELEHWLSKDKHTIARRRVEPFDESRTKTELTNLIQRLDDLAQSAADRLRSQGVQVDQSQIGLTEFPEEWIGESNYLSRRICDKLWGSGAVETEAGYGKFRDNCLTCHGGYQPGDAGFALGETDQAKIGIGCLYCHQVGDNTQWVTEHAGPNPEQNWRLRKPEDKAAAGMRDLVGTSNQASLCFDCHVGNREKNMFVSHEMYAAGHPPIPSIELQTFCTEMPQHWQTPGQLYKTLEGSSTRDEYFQTNYPGVVDEATGATYWNTRKMLIGALAARGKALDLMIESAAAHQWADYSLYDCAACHHELQSNSFRQQRGYPGAPGRPRQIEWPDALLNIAYLFHGRESVQTTRDLERELEREFSAQPFGNADRVRQAAESLRQQVTAAIATVETKPVTADIAAAVLRGLAETPAAELVTYDSARQVVWAMQTIVNEMEANGADVNQDIAQKVKALGSPETAGISAALPSGRKQFIYSESLDKDLQLRANFEPLALKKKLDEIRGLLANRRKSPSVNATVTR